jgi:SAM-dependent methyltransferase
VVSAPEFGLYPEMRAHFDAVYDQLIGSDGPRGASPLIDVGSGNGSALAAVVAGTNMTGVALDLREAAEWMGPHGFDIVLADAAQLPFPNGAAPMLLSMETIEWFDAPPAALREMARVASKRVLLVHSDWQSLWFDSDDPDTSREFTRLFAGSVSGGKPIRDLLDDFVSAAGLRLATHEIHVIRGETIGPDTYARHLLGLLRDWLCNQLGAVRARRFDQWRKDLEARAVEGRFGFSLDRHVVVAEH